MADMKKIIDDIMLEGENDAAAIIGLAEKDAEKTIENAQKECAAITKNADARRSDELSRLKKRYASSRATQSRNSILSAKQQIIDNAVTEAYRCAADIHGKEYDNTVIKLLRPRIRSGKCTLYLPEDKKPSDYLESQINALMKESGSDCTISYARKNVRDGFILVYGGIEENCTFEALFEEKRGEIYETAARLLFETEESV
jgi:V/A-type H+-transporting ATPase subunit E